MAGGDAGLGDAGLTKEQVILPDWWWNHDGHDASQKWKPFSLWVTSLYS